MTTPPMNLDDSRSLNLRMSRGCSSLASMIRAPSSASVSSVWSSSACVASLDPKKWTSSMAIRSTLRYERRKASTRLALRAATKSFVNASPVVYLTTAVG